MGIFWTIPLDESLFQNFCVSIWHFLSGSQLSHNFRNDSVQKNWLLSYLLQQVQYIQIYKIAIFFNITLPSCLSIVSALNSLYTATPKKSIFNKNFIKLLPKCVITAPNCGGKYAIRLFIQTVLQNKPFCFKDDLIFRDRIWKYKTGFSIYNFHFAVI